MRPCLQQLVLVSALLAAAPARAARCPNVYIVLDRSLSMDSDGKWNGAVQAVKTITSSHEASVRFGLNVFPGELGGGCEPGSHIVNCDFLTAREIARQLDGMSPLGMTPTGETLAAIASRPELTDPARPKFVLLVTDGEPTCGSGGYFDEYEYAVGGVEALRRPNDAASDVKTFVVGFGDAVADSETLDRMAEAGGTARGAPATHKFYDASDSASLQAALDAIVRVVRGELGAQTCDDSCYGRDNPCPSGQMCVAKVTTTPGGTTNLGQCIADPCAQVACPADQFCRGGTCHPSCLLECPLGEYCQDGACVTDPCATGVFCTCPATCPPNLSCIDGRCDDNPCRYIDCPDTSSYCDRGSCSARVTLPATDGGSSVKPDGGTIGDGGDESGICGCRTAGGGLGVVLVASLTIAGLAPRRRR